VLRLSEVEDYGFQAIGMGLIQAAECEPGGAMQIQHYMGRISDSMPHLWGALYAGGDGAQFQLDGGDEGGAVLEYRLRYHQALRCYDRFAVMSGIAAVGAKVQRFAHLLCNADSGEVCVSAQAAAVRMDLHARRVLQLSAERQARLGERLIKPMVQ
jgi:acyl-CoA thioester hydrolase